MRKLSVYFMMSVCILSGCLQPALTSATEVSAGNQNSDVNLSEASTYIDLDNQVHCNINTEDMEAINPVADERWNMGISTLSIDVAGVNFDNFTLKANGTYTLKHNIAYKNYNYARVKFKPNKTCKILVGLYNVNTNSVVAADEISVQAGKSYTVTSALRKGQKVNFVFGNENAFNVGMSAVAIEKWVC